MEPSLLIEITKSLQNSLQNVRKQKEILDNSLIMALEKDIEKAKEKIKLKEIAEVKKELNKKADFVFFKGYGSYVSIKLKKDYEYYKPLIAQLDSLIKQIAPDIHGIRILEIPKLSQDFKETYLKIKKIKKNLDELETEYKRMIQKIKQKIKARIQNKVLKSFEKYKKLKEI